MSFFDVFFCRAKNGVVPNITKGRSGSAPHRGGWSATRQATRPGEKPAICLKKKEISSLFVFLLASFLFGDIHFCVPGFFLEDVFVWLARIKPLRQEKMLTEDLWVVPTSKCFSGCSSLHFPHICNFIWEASTLLKTADPRPATGVLAWVSLHPLPCPTGHGHWLPKQRPAGRWSKICDEKSHEKRSSKWYESRNFLEPDLLNLWSPFWKTLITQTGNVQQNVCREDREATVVHSPQTWLGAGSRLGNQTKRISNTNIK